MATDLALPQPQLNSNGERSVFQWKANPINWAFIIGVAISIGLAGCFLATWYSSPHWPTQPASHASHLPTSVSNFLIWSWCFYFHLATWELFEFFSEGWRTSLFYISINNTMGVRITNIIRSKTMFATQIVRWPIIDLPEIFMIIWLIRSGDRLHLFICNNNNIYIQRLGFSWVMFYKS